MLSLVAVLVARVIAMAMFCGCAGTGGGEAAEQVSYNADINVCMLVNCFHAVGGYTGSEGDYDGNVCGCDSAGECEAAA